MKRKVLPLFVGTLILCGGILELGAYLGLRYVLKQPTPVLSGEALEGNVHIFDRSSPILWYGVKQHYKQVFRTNEFYTTVKTNNVGFREERDYAGEAIDIGFVGDSFTFGHGVEFGERYSDLLRGYFPEQSIFSYSYANGYAPPHYYLFLKRNIQYVAKVVVMGLYLGNDLTDDIEDMEFHLDANGEVSALGSRSTEISEDGTEVTHFYAEHRRFLNLLDRFHFGRLSLVVYQRLAGKYQRLRDGVSPHVLSQFHRGQLARNNLLSLEYVRKLSRYLESRGSRLVVFVIPEAFFIGDYQECIRWQPYTADLCCELREKRYLQKALGKWFRENQVEYIDPTDRFQALEGRGTRLYFESDPHWTREGHRAAAELLHEYLLGAGGGQRTRFTSASFGPEFKSGRR